MDKVPRMHGDIQAAGSEQSSRFIPKSETAHSTQDMLSTTSQPVVDGGLGSLSFHIRNASVDLHDSDAPPDQVLPHRFNPNKPTSATGRATGAVLFNITNTQPQPAQAPVAFGFKTPKPNGATSQAVVTPHREIKKSSLLAANSNTLPSVPQTSVDSARRDFNVFSDVDDANRSNPNEHAANPSSSNVRTPQHSNVKKASVASKGGMSGAHPPPAKKTSTKQVDPIKKIPKENKVVNTRTKLRVEDITLEMFIDNVYMKGILSRDLEDLDVITEDFDALYAHKFRCVPGLTKRQFRLVFHSGMDSFVNSRAIYAETRTHLLRILLLKLEQKILEPIEQAFIRAVYERYFTQGKYTFQDAYVELLCEDLPNSYMPRMNTSIMQPRFMEEGRRLKNGIELAVPSEARDHDYVLALSAAQPLLSWSFGGRGY
ncbi:hypothetical protein EJ08DRAFT_341319 [Tothia fuscella]|uniref:Uncharacterized protein n=1 Tax=Tothia fuscella TaxID=1048955 RepID=A0A9P4U335_9PEZI|nr:hypothetical protein EJ08DRAFT_341319 [Tothia fuscella]